MSKPWYVLAWATYAVNFVGTFPPSRPMLSVAERSYFMVLGCFFLLLAIWHGQREGQ